MSRWLVLALGSLTFGTSAPQPFTSAAERFWPRWRGPYATGVSKTATPPTGWSNTKNIRWKIEIPGRGSASPIVWGDRVYLLTAVPADVPVEASHAPRGSAPSKHRFLVLGIDRATSRVVWERTVREKAPHEMSHPENGTWAPEVFASPFGAAGRIDIPSRDAITVVLKHSPTLETVAENKLSDGFDASPALVDREIYQRGYKYLYCITQ